MDRAIDLALQAEHSGSLPIGAVIVLDGEIIAEGASAIITPHYHPGRHAETEALTKVDVALWKRAGEMTCYTTLEPCVMCYGALLLHGVGRIVFGANDPEGGASAILGNLPPFYGDKTRLPEWLGPVLPEQCDPLYVRARKVFEAINSGHSTRT